MNIINYSLFELFKLGPGPSSSHTIGPMKAGYDFVQRLKSLPVEKVSGIKSLEVRLFGSLSATGKGHGTDRAVLAGLLGTRPQDCPPGFMDEFDHEKNKKHTISLGQSKIAISRKNLIFDKVTHDFEHSNTLLFKAIGDEGPIYERRYYSIGGGFLKGDGYSEENRSKPAFLFSNMTQLKEHLVSSGLFLHQLVMENEKSITQKTETEIHLGLDLIIECMENSVERGLNARGILPGPLGLHRKAHQLYENAGKVGNQIDRMLLTLSACCFAAGEENAIGNKIVTAPTAGSAGVIPGILYIMKNFLNLSHKDIYKGFMAAAAVGMLVKNNASIAGAEVGCQGEIGVASAMAAAMLAHATGHRFKAVENAAEIALEHHLGLTCDPIGGYVQIPCIERNAFGAAKAYQAYLIAKSVDYAHHIVDLDSVIRAMASTGRDMDERYKETSLGGLAVSLPEC